MPSLRSNKNKLAIPSLPPPAETVCIPVTVPNDARWIGLFLGALYRLTQQIWYDRDDAHSAKIVAAYWQDIYLETVKRVWGCEGGMFDIRVSPDDECLIQKTNDGETWVDAFRLDTDCALTKLKRNPYNGRIGWEVEDLGFYEIPDGPWVDNYPQGTAIPNPRSEPTDDEKLCAAAANAAEVITQTYRSTGETLLDVVAGTDWDYAAALGSVIQGVLMIIGAAATQPYVALSAILGIVGVRQQYIDYPLTTDDTERLTCILLDHATLLADGAVIFDFQAVWNDINLDSPKNGLVRFLLTMLGGDALNYAGAVELVESPDCSPCLDMWCYDFNFAGTLDTWAIDVDYLGNSFGVSTATGVEHVNARTGPSSWSRGVQMLLNMPAGTVLTNVSMTFDRVASGFTSTNLVWWSITIDDVVVASQTDGANPAGTGTDIVKSWEGELVLTDESEIRIYVRSSATLNGTYGGSVLIKSVELRGAGANPFGDDNCVE